MKYIVCGDTHLGHKKSSPMYHNVLKDLFSDICEYADTHNITKMIHMGDFFDNRNHITITSIDVAQYIGDMLSEQFEKVYMIIGNHDTTKKDDMFPTSLSLFKDYINIDIIGEPIKKDNILMLPWLFNKDEMIDADIVLGHFDINGFPMNVSDTKSEGYPLNIGDFKKYNLVLSGHYHLPSEISNIKYVGSPYQLTFNEAETQMGFYVLDTDTLILELINFDKYPHHKTFKDIDLPEGIEGDVIKLIFTDDYGITKNSEIIERYKQLKPYKLKVKPYYIDQTFTDDVIDVDDMILDKDELLYSYLDKSELPEGINLMFLKKLVGKLQEELNDGK